MFREKQKISNVKQKSTNHKPNFMNDNWSHILRILFLNLSNLKKTDSEIRQHLREYKISETIKDFIYFKNQ